MAAVALSFRLNHQLIAFTIITASRDLLPLPVPSMTKAERGQKKSDHEAEKDGRKDEMKDVGAQKDARSNVPFVARMP